MLDLQEFTHPGLTALHGAPDPLPGLPQCPGWTTVAGAIAVWTAPRSWLCFHAPGLVLPVPRAQCTPMDGARSLFALSGPLAREALATILPLDLHPRAFPPGAAAATLGAHLPLLVWREAETFHLSCQRSYGDSLRAALLVAGRGRGLRVRDAVRYSPAPAAG
ncbi:hypothetical protein [Falsiroseomonas sp.]|uniref:hypothetical protein n=1 Tax=Falsiroseomonas sp. TaxID=2870721 RepID=UPI003F6E4F10